MSSDPSLESHGHLPIMVREIMELLSPQAGETVVDLTVGRGGHAVELCRAVGSTGRYVGFDLDESNLDFAARRISSELGTDEPEAVFLHANFSDAPGMLDAHDVAADVVLGDLGFASNQMDDPVRGFSFRDEGPLDMRLDPSSHVSARDIVGESSEQELADLIHRYGEDPLSRKIARTIVAKRRNLPIETTLQLAEIVREAYGGRARHSRLHPATRTFMALRIAVNNELGSLEQLRDRIAEAADGNGWIRRSARIGFLTFHSLEDRIVKRLAKDLSDQGLVKRLNRKPLTPTPEELAKNPRARPAKLRVFQLVE